MRMDKTIYLISQPDAPNGTNDMGDPIKVPVKRETFANKKSIQRSEFYQAAATGLKPELTFEVWTREYAGELELEFKESTYTIIRTFDKGDEFTELICSGLAKG